MNKNIQQLISKGLKYREPSKNNWRKTEMRKVESITKYALQQFKREQVDELPLVKWNDGLKALVKSWISNL